MIVKWEETLEVFTTSLLDYAKKAELSKLTDKFDKFTLKSEVDILRTQLGKYAEKSEIINLKVSIHENKKLFEKCIPMEILDKGLDKLKNDLTNEIKKCANEKNVNKFIEEIQGRLTLIEAENLRYRSMNDDMRNKNKQNITQIRTELKAKATKSELSEVDQKQKLLCKATYVDNIISKIEPQVEFMRSKIEQFGTNIEDFNKIINRFDEVIYDKASK